MSSTPSTISSFPLPGHRRWSKKRRSVKQGGGLIVFTHCFTGGDGAQRSWVYDQGRQEDGGKRWESPKTSCRLNLPGAVHVCHHEGFPGRGAGEGGSNTS